MKLTVLGPGCWGLTLAWLLNDNFDEVTVWGRESDLYDDLVINKHCSKPLEVQLDSKVEVTSDLKKAIDGADIILSVVATAGVRPVCEQLKAAGINPNTPLVNASKGLELNSLMRMSEVIKDVLPEQKVVILSDDFELENAIYHKTQTEKNQIRLITDSRFVLTGILSGNVHDTCLYSGQQNLVDVMKEALKNKIELLGK